MNKHNRLDIDMNKNCKRCGDVGATQSGYCLKCASDNILDGNGDLTKRIEPEFRGGDWAEADLSVIHTAEELVPRFHPDLKMARIGFLFRREAQVRNGKKVLGCAQKVTDRLKPFLDYDFIIWVAKDEWDRMEIGRRRALIDHELCHCTFGDSGWKIRPHDFEEFGVIIERHGFWTHELLKVQELARQEHLPGFGTNGKVEAVSVRQFDMIEDAEPL